MGKPELNVLMNSLEKIERDRTLLRCFPVDKYIGHLEKYPRLASYKYVSPAVKHMDEAIVEGWGQEGLERYHKLVLGTAISIARSNPRLAELPGEIRECYHVNFRRILARIEANAGSSDSYRHSPDRFQKDLGVCTLRMIPTGSRKVELCRVPVRFLVQDGVMQFVRGVYLLSRLRGISPFYFSHMDSNDPDAMKEFNYEGTVTHHKRVAMLLELNKDVKGTIGASWFLDPEIKSISPRLSYLREIVEKNGGRFFYAGRGAHTVKDALLKSPTRRRLYQEGRYSPKNYLYIWPRRPLIEWTRSLKDWTADFESAPFAKAGLR